MAYYEINDEYFNWLFNMVCEDRFSPRISYRKLLRYLHDTTFRYTIPRDMNRADDGLSLRYRFSLDMALDENLDNYIYGPCSVLEMMIALSLRCEEDIMDNPNVGDRTGQWFWNMVINLGLGSMTDDKFDIYYVEDVVNRFLDREYESDGTGGLFTIRNCDTDLRNVEIWYQLCWYLDSIT